MKTATNTNHTPGPWMVLADPDLPDLLTALNWSWVVLPIFEKAYPKDDRPRKAIEAARAYALNPSKETAYAAAYAAAADADAANAAACASAYEAAEAAEAAANAAHAAYAAAKAAIAKAEGRA